MIVNTALLKNPANWLIVGFMLLIIGIAGHIALSFFGAEPSAAPTTPAEQNTPASTPVKLRSDGAFAAVSVGQ